jgi:hypothetical protein
MSLTSLIAAAAAVLMPISAGFGVVLWSKMRARRRAAERAPEPWVQTSETV